MISQEFLDELNNSDLGKYLRLENCNYNKYTLEKLKPYFKNLPETTDLNIYLRANALSIIKYDKTPKSLKEVLLNENTFKFDGKNIQKFNDKIFINCNVLPLDNTSMNLLTKLTNTVNTKTLKIYNLNDNINFSDLDIKELELNYGDIENVNFSHLKQLESLKLNDVNLDDLYVFKDLNKLKNLDIKKGKNNKDIDISGITELFPKLEDVSISGQKVLDDDFKKLLNLKDLKNLNIKHKKLSRFDEKANDNSIILLNPDELDLALKSSIYKNDVKFIYVGKKCISSDAIKEIEKYNLNFTVLDPLVINDNTKDILNSSYSNIHIDGDLSNYSYLEIYNLNSKINDILEGAPKDALDLEKIIYLYSKIGSEVTYDVSGMPENENYTEKSKVLTRSLKGGLLDGNRLVCTGYALELNYFLRKLGVESKVVSGEIYEGKISKGFHDWNQVKVDGEWYNLDLTWDSKNLHKGKDLKWFLLSDDDFYKYKTFNEYGESVNGTRENVSVINDLLLNFIDSNGNIDMAHLRSKDVKPYKCYNTYDGKKVQSKFDKYGIKLNTKNENCNKEFER